MKTSKIFTIFLAGFFFFAGCATVQLEDGTHPNRAANGALIGAALGSVPGLITKNKGVGVAGALAGGAIGGWLGSQADQKTYENSRKYQEDLRREWQETYAMLASRGGGRGGAPTVIVASRNYSRCDGDYNGDWQCSSVLAVEQGLRQRGFVVPFQNENRQYYRRRGEYSANDADFVAEVQMLDLGSSIKVVVTLRSLTGNNQLDRQGVGQVVYNNNYRDYGYYGRHRGNSGPTGAELREKAATLAAKRAILNLFTSPFDSTLDAAG